MRELKRISKSTSCLPVLLLSFIFICLISNHFSNNSNSQSLVGSQHDFQRKNLVQALRKASMSDKTVILTVVNGTWAKPGSILDLFLESFRIRKGTRRLLNHLLIVAEDNQAFRYCKSKHPHCFELEKFTKIPSRIQGNFMLSPSRLILLTRIIELGYHVAFTNADVMWLRNPITELGPDSELSIACDLYPIDNGTVGIKGEGGFFHLKSNERTHEFIKSCNLKRVLYPDPEHQSLCKITGDDNYIDLIGMKVTYFTEVNFGRLCVPCDLNQMYIIQANCCEDIDSKIHDLKLVLDDWRNFMELSANNASSKWSPSSYRAPQKCIK